MKFLTLTKTYPDFTNRLIKYFYQNMRIILEKQGHQIIEKKIIDETSNLKYWKRMNKEDIIKELENNDFGVDYLIIFQYINNYKSFEEVFKKYKIILINTEQTTNITRMIKNTVEYLKEHNNYIFVDYNRENYLYFSKFIDESRYLVLEPYLGNFKDEYNKTIDLAIYRRKCKYNDFLVENHLKNIITKCENMAGKFNKKRIEFIAKCKIFINIHANKNYKICETHRVNELVASKCLIVSQRCLNEELVELKNFIFFVDDDKIEEFTENLLENYDEYYEKIYGNKKNQDIFRKIRDKYEILCERIKE